MENNKRFDMSIHYIMAICGGFFGVYAIVSRLNIFGSAQTANLIGLVCDIVGKNLLEALLRVGALLIYISAIVLVTVLEKKTDWNLKYLALSIEGITIILLGFFPEHMNPMIALYPMFFMTAFQWCVFKGAKGYACSTIFSTNNLKQTCSALTEYIILDKEQEKERKEKMTKAKVFGGTVLSFHFGVMVGYLACQSFGIRSIWICLIPIVVVTVLLVFENEKGFKNNKLLSYIK